MSVICTTCGTNYTIDPKKMAAQVIKFECKKCGNHVIADKKKITAGGTPPSAGSTTSGLDSSSAAPTVSLTKVRGYGIRSKLFVFLLLLVAAFGVQAYYLISQLNKITELYGEQGTEIIKEMAEAEIMKTAQAVAQQARLYLESHPYLAKDQFMGDEEFKKILIQKVGKSGYTALNEKGRDGIWRTWAHISPNVCPPKLNDMSKLKEPLGESFDGFWKILTGVESGKPSKGYYRWQEKDKSFKDKYMVSYNVSGTPFNISATTYIDEFTEPMIRLENRGKAIAKEQAIKDAILIAVIILVLVIIVVIFGGKLTSNIKYLSLMTDKISRGELDTNIEVRTKDELAVLAESISRLQQSVRLSLKRLRK